MEIKQDMDFRDLENNCWGQAVDILKEISDADKEDALMDYLEEIYYDEIPTLTEINDVLAYDWEQVYEAIGIVQWDELKDLLNDKAIKKAQKVIQEIEDKWYEFSVSEDNKDEKGNVIYEDMEDWVNDEYSNEPYNLVTSAVDLIADEVDSIIDGEEKTDDWDSMVEAITMCGLESFFDDFEDIVDMTSNLDSWISDHL
jgi:hypothetical protein